MDQPEVHGVRDRMRGRSQTNDPESSNRGSGHYQSKNPIQSSRGSGRRRVHREPMPDQVYRQDYDTTTRDSDYDHYNQEIEAPIQISEQRSRDTRSPRSQTSHLNHRHSRRESRYDEPKRDVSSRGDIDPHLRSRIRHRVKQKHLHAAPLVRWTKFMHSDTKNHIVAVLGEFIGTTMFLFFAFAGTQAANFGAGQEGKVTPTAAGDFNSGTIIFIALSFGFSLMVNAWVFYRISGGLFNPAVTLSLALTGDLEPLRAFLIFIAQISGACFAAELVKTLFPTPFSVATTLGAGTSLAQGVFIEALCTAELVFTIIMLAKEKHRATFIAPVGIGLALFIAELVAVFYTGGSLNPARTFGPAAVTRNFASDHWVYWVGPALGSLLATGFFALFKVLEYEMTNPGQDGDEENDPTQNPDHEAARTAEERRMEIEEIQQIEKEEGGFDNITSGERSAADSVLNSDKGFHGTTEEENSVREPRSWGPDLEAQHSGEESRWTTIRR